MTIKPEHETALRLLRSALDGREFAPVPQADWEKVLKFAARQHVHGICFQAVRMLPRELAPEKRILASWLLSADKLKAGYERRQKLAALLAAELAKEGVRFHVLKGMSFARYYDSPELRYSEDIDCLLSDYEAGNMVSERLGASVDRSQQKHSQIRWKGVMIENHRTCTHSDIDGLEEYLVGMLAGEGRDGIGPDPLEFPPLEFDALYALYHAFAHFVLENGILLQHVTDWIQIRRQLDAKGLRQQVAEDCNRFHMHKFLRAMDEVADMVSGVKCCGDLSESARLLWEDTVCERETVVHRNLWLIRRVRMLVHKYRNGWKYRMYTDTTAWNDIGKSIGRYLKRVIREPRVLKYVFGKK